MASKKRSVLFERTSSVNKGESPAPEPAAKSGCYLVGVRAEAEPAAISPPKVVRPLEDEALEAFVTAHVLSRW